MVCADKIKHLRQQLGWSQEQLALVSGVSVRTIQRVEKTGECSLESKMALASALSTTAAELNPETNSIELNHAGWSKWVCWLGLLSIVGYYTWKHGFFSSTVQDPFLIMLPLLLVFVGLFAGFAQSVKALKLTFLSRVNATETEVYGALKTTMKLIQAAYAAALLTAILVSLNALKFLGLVNIWPQLATNGLLALLCAIFIVEVILRPLKIVLERRLAIL